MSWANPGNRGTIVLIVAVVVFVLVGAAVFGGMFLLARSGALDAFSRRNSSVAVATARDAQPLPTRSRQVTQPAAPAIVTATPTRPTPTPSPTRSPTATVPPTRTPIPTSTQSPTPTDTPNPYRGKYLVEYHGCVKHGSGVGTIKGQIFDREGNIIPGAEVYISLNDWAYDRPARSNAAGWYEFYLDNDLKVKIVGLWVNGQEVPLAGHEDVTLKSQPGCFEHVDIRQQ